MNFRVIWRHLTKDVTKTGPSSDLNPIFHNFSNCLKNVIFTEFELKTNTGGTMRYPKKHVKDDLFT